MSRGDWTYASNGIIAVWVPRRLDVPKNDDAPDIKTRIADKLDFSTCVPWVAMEFDGGFGCLIGRLTPGDKHIGGAPCP